MRSIPLFLTAILVFFTVVSVPFLLTAETEPPPAAVETTVAPEDPYGVLGEQVHAVMKDQKKRLEKILEGFLLGDFALIWRALDAVTQDLDTITGNYDPLPGAETDQKKALGELKRHTEMLKLSVDEKKYSEAYGHFVNMTYQCIQCHQVRRQWGLFDEKIEEEEVKEPAEGEEGKAAPVRPRARSRKRSNIPEAVVDVSYD